MRTVIETKKNGDFIKRIINEITRSDGYVSSQSIIEIPLHSCGIEKRDWPLCRMKSNCYHSKDCEVIV